MQGEKEETEERLRRKPRSFSVKGAKGADGGFPEEGQGLRAGERQTARTRPTPGNSSGWRSGRKRLGNRVILLYRSIAARLVSWLHCIFYMMKNTEKSVTIIA